MWKCKHKDQYEYDEKALINWKTQFYNFWYNFKWWKSFWIQYVLPYWFENYEMVAMHIALSMAFIIVLRA
jgi:hypothetical protein